MSEAVRSIEQNFKYHAPQNDTVKTHYIRLREHGKALALDIVARVPECRERSLAITKLEEAIMWANAGIARNS